MNLPAISCQQSVTSSQSDADNSQLITGVQQNATINQLAVDNQTAVSDTQATTTDQHVELSQHLVVSNLSDSDRQPITEGQQDAQQNASINQSTADNQLPVINNQTAVSDTQATTTDQHVELGQHLVNNLPDSDCQPTTEGQQDAANNRPSAVGNQFTFGNAQSIVSDQQPSTSKQLAFTDLLPIPRSNVRKGKFQSQSGRKRKVGHAQVITESPYKQALEQASVRPKRKPKKVAKQIKLSNEKQGEVDETPCMYCEIVYCDSDVPWFRCRTCKRWACGTCVTIGKKKSFCCSSCS